MSTGKLVMLLAALTVVVNVGLAIMFTSPTHIEKPQQSQEVAQSDLLSNEVRRSIDKPEELAITPPSQEVLEANKELFDTSSQSEPSPAQQTTQEEQDYVPGKSLEEIEKTMAKVTSPSATPAPNKAQSEEEIIEEIPEEKVDLSFNTPMFNAISKAKPEQKATKEEDIAKEESVAQEEAVLEEETVVEELAKNEEILAPPPSEVDEDEDVEIVQIIAAKEPEKEEKVNEIGTLEIKPEPTVKQEQQTKSQSTPTTSSGSITAVDCSYNDEVLYIRVKTSSAVKAKTMYVGNPERAILDILGSWKLSFTPKLPNNPYSTAIRVGRQPDRTRFVIDITTKKFTRRLVQIDSNTVELQVNFK